MESPTQLGAPPVTGPTPDRPATAGRRRAKHARPRSWRWSWILPVAAYLLLAAVANLPAWVHGVSHQIQNEGGDLPEQVWFLGSTAYSLLHGANPFLTQYVNVPHGANLMVNTTMFFPGVVFAPLTYLAGPVTTFNVLVVLAIAGSATAAFGVFRRWVRWTPAAFAGGLLYGFSPYVVGAGYGHLNVLMIAFPPLVLLLLHSILVIQPGRPALRGLGLGLLVTAQFLTSTDILASTAVMALVGVALLAIVRPRQVPVKAAYAAKALGTAVLVAAVLCGYPMWVLLFGPNHITGPLHPISALTTFSSDAVGLVVPTRSQAIAPHAAQRIANAFVGADPSENATYLGIPLVLVSLYLSIRWRRVPVVRFASIMALVAVVLSFGPRLQVDGHLTAVRLPYVVVKRLPLLQNLLPVRFTIYVFLSVALLLAVGLDHMHRRRPATRNPATAAVTALVALFALFPLVPHWPYPFTDTTPPLFFRTDAVRTIPPGSVLLPFPFPGPFHAEPMTWQALAGFRWKTPGGYVLLPAPGTGGVTLGGGSETQALFDDAFAGTPLPALSPGVRCAVDDDLQFWHVQTVVVPTVGARPDDAVRVVEAALGRGPQSVAGAAVFDDVQPSVTAQRARLHCPPGP